MDIFNIKKNLRVIFIDEAEVVFSDILKSFGLQETDEEFDEYILHNQESRESIARDAVVVMAKKLIPQEKLIEILQKHLQIPKESAGGIIINIKNKLLPLLLVFPDEKFNDPIFREEISKKIFGEEEPTTEMPPLPIVKKVEIKDVEKNAVELEKKKESKTAAETIGESLKNMQDKYRESTE